MTSLAAIIEKEVLIRDEFGLVSSVFHNRLERNMLLQSDPTVIYAAGDSYKGDITYRMLRYKHPFNTYTSKGLTPYPIAYVSKQSLQAAVSPKQTDYLFFVARGDGRHEFNVSLEGHEQAVRKYILGQ